MKICRVGPLRWIIPEAFVTLSCYRLCYQRPLNVSPPLEFGLIDVFHKF